MTWEPWERYPCPGGTRRVRVGSVPGAAELAVLLTVSPIGVGVRVYLDGHEQPEHAAVWGDVEDAARAVDAAALQLVARVRARVGA